MRLFRLAAIALSLHALLCVTGCSAGTPEDPNAGAQCQQVLHAACNRAINDCKLPEWESTVEQCVSDNQAACCADSCNKPALSPESDIQACQRAIAIAACNVFDQHGLPTQCQHVVRY